MAEEKLFVRKATGLVREIGFLTAIIIVIANTVGAGWQKRVFQYTGLAPLPENQYLAGIPPMVMAFIIGGLVVLLSVLAVAVVTSAMPRSGGGYVAISRILGPFWGFIGAWLEFLSIAWSFGLIAVIVFEGIYKNIGPIAFGVNIGAGLNEWFYFGAGLLLVLIFTVVGVFGVKLTGLLLQVMFWIPAVLTFYVLGLVSQVSTSSVTAGMTNLFGAGVTPDKYVIAATDPTLGTTLQGQAAGIGGYWGAFGTALIGAYFAYIGYAASTFVAGEIKQANKNIPRSIVLATLLIIALYVGVSWASSAALSGIAVHCVNGNTVTAGACSGNGLQYSLLSAWSYLSFGGGTSLKDAGLPGVNLWTSAVSGVTASGIGLGSVNVLLVLFGVFWIANDIPPFILTASRIVFAMSFDRVLPAPFANVNDRFHSPVNAVIVTGVVAILGCISESKLFDAGGPLNGGSSLALSTVLGSGGGVATTDLMDSLFFTFFTLSLVVLPLRASKRQIFDTAPYKPGGKWGMVALGLGGFAANLFVDYEFLIAPGGDYGLGTVNWSDISAISGLIFLIGIVVLGAVIYFAHRMKRGINYATIFAQIPPE